MRKKSRRGRRCEARRERKRWRESRVYATKKEMRGGGFKHNMEYGVLIKERKERKEGKEEERRKGKKRRREKKKGGRGEEEKRKEKAREEKEEGERG
ncbi:hypothetical protein, partial [Listeria monocytogenes]|uniref:hypothetical protein n=1 Tax=Listeria monocytogenes TaxID=1639 RepID=UPI001125A59C